MCRRRSHYGDRVHVLIAPDAFKGTLAADEAARAIALGWSRARPSHALLVKPLSDGGPGFVAALAEAHGVPLLRCRVTHSLGETVDAHWCMHAGTAYVESAQAVGLDRGLDVMRAASSGVGQLLRCAVDAGATRIVVGLGGTNVTDGGAGMLAALGATATDGAGRPVPLDQGPQALANVTEVHLEAPLEAMHGVELVLATDVDVPLLGPRGASLGFGPQKGATDAQLPLLEHALGCFAEACGRREDGRDPAIALGAGAAGGLGFALLRLGGRRESGIDFVWDESGIELAGIDLVVTGEGHLDWQSMRGKVVSGVARRAQDRGVPVIAIAGRVGITPRERSEMGLDAAYSLVDMFGEARATGDPAATLADAAERLTRTWG